MKKFIVETYYTCTFKTVHSLNDLNESELSKIDSRTDGDVEVIDVKLNNRKTKKIGDKSSKEPTTKKTAELIDQKINKLAKPIASSMIHFKRKGQILDQIQKMLSTNNNNNSANMNYFLLPDTLLHQSKVDYYKDLVELIYEILGQRYETASFSDEESKLYIEGYST